MPLKFPPRKLLLLLSTLTLILLQTPPASACLQPHPWNPNYCLQCQSDYVPVNSNGVLINLAAPNPPPPPYIGCAQPITACRYYARQDATRFYCRTCQDASNIPISDPSNSVFECSLPGNLIPGCLFFEASPDQTIRCRQCKPGSFLGTFTSLSSTASQFVSNSSPSTLCFVPIPHCLAYDASSIFSAPKCVQCSQMQGSSTLLSNHQVAAKSFFGLVGTVSGDQCVKAIENCLHYDATGTLCESCSKGYLQDGKCLKFTTCDPQNCNCDSFADRVDERGTVLKTWQFQSFYSFGCVVKVPRCHVYDMKDYSCISAW